MKLIPFSLSCREKLDVSLQNEALKLDVFCLQGSYDLKVILKYFICVFASVNTTMVFIPIVNHEFLMKHNNVDQIGMNK